MYPDVEIQINMEQVYTGKLKIVNLNTAINLH